MQSSKDEKLKKSAPNKKSSDKEKPQSHPDKGLDSDYRPTRYGSTDKDRKEKSQSGKSL